MHGNTSGISRTTAGQKFFQRRCLPTTPHPAKKTESLSSLQQIAAHGSTTGVDFPDLIGWTSCVNIAGCFVGSVRSETQCHHSQTGPQTGVQAGKQKSASERPAPQVGFHARGSYLCRKDEFLPGLKASGRKIEHASMHYKLTIQIASSRKSCGCFGRPVR